jgi:hypothetical protein
VEISPEAFVDGGDQDIGKTDDVLDSHVMIGTVIAKGTLSLFRPLCEFVYGIVIFLRQMSRECDPSSVNGFREIHEVLGIGRFLIRLNDLHECNPRLGVYSLSP